MRLRMFKNRVFPIIILLVSILISCGSKSKEDSITKNDQKPDINIKQDSNMKSLILGVNRIDQYLSLLNGKRIAIVANQTSLIEVRERRSINDTTMGSAKVTYHLVDYLNAYNGITVNKVFAPEHGFRGTADAGELVKDGIDTKTGIPIVSLYGKNKKPSSKQLEGIDIVLFDIQDVGARFYTYISSLHYVMEACAEASIPVMVFDRPNPNGHYIDGPILELEHKSFVGMHPVPVVHGMTIGEYAQMINGEGWLNNGIKCDLMVIEMLNYDRNIPYSLPIKPSPNLPNDQAINLYPSLCFFEGTNVNAGRGTSKQFQIYGSPYLDKTIYEFKYIPMPNEGAKYPKHDNVLCYGEDLSKRDRLRQLDLSYLIQAYENSIDQPKFFNDFFTKLAGTTDLREQIEKGQSESQIRESWKEGLTKFKSTRSTYLIYE